MALSELSTCIVVTRVVTPVLFAFEGRAVATAANGDEINPLNLAELSGPQAPGADQGWVCVP